MHCGREFLPPVSVDSVRPWRVEIEPGDVELHGPWDPGGPGIHYSGPKARLYYREYKYSRVLRGGVALSHVRRSLRIGGRGQLPA